MTNLVIGDQQKSKMTVSKAAPKSMNCSQPSKLNHVVLLLDAFSDVTVF